MYNTSVYQFCDMVWNLDVCPLNVSVMRSLDFVINIFFMKLLPRDARSASAVLLSYVVRPSVSPSVRP